MSGQRFFSTTCPCDPPANGDGRDWCRCVSYTIDAICQGGPHTALRAFAQARAAGKLGALEAIATVAAATFPPAAQPALQELLTAASVRDELASAWAIGRLHVLVASPDTNDILEEFADLFDAQRARLARTASRRVRDCGGVGPEDVAQHLALKTVTGMRRKTIRDAHPHWLHRALKSATADIVRTENRHRLCVHVEVEEMAPESDTWPDAEWSAVRRVLLAFLREADAEDRELVLRQVAAARKAQRVTQAQLGGQVDHGREWVCNRMRRIRARLAELLRAELAR